MLPTVMKAAVMQDIGKIKINDLPVPKPSRDEVLIKVKAVGICGSDVHLFAHGRIGPHVVVPPYVLGHEASGEIAAVGDAVTNLKAGDRITMEPGIPCGKCEHCRSGHYNLCRYVVFWAAPPVQGVLAEYITHKADFCYKIADTVPFDVASMAEPLSVGIYAVRRGKVMPGKTVAILGMGPIGQTTLLSALAFGTNNIIACDIVENRLKIAQKMGAKLTLNSTKQDLKKAVSNFTEGTGVDLVIETAGAMETAAEAVHIVKSGGTIVMVGNPPESKVFYPLLSVVERELTVLGSFRYINTYPTAVDILASEKFDFKSLITNHYPLSKAQEAFELVRDRKNDCMKVIINMDEA
jgi:L-iditol 2-dehydrogenase